MSYEKRYNEALERARKIHHETEFDYEKGMIEEIFPELKESEDERMKKAIMHVLYENYTDAAVIEGVEIAEIVAWLEKQGKNKSDFSVIHTWKYIVDMVLTEKDGIGNYLDNPDTERIAKKLQEKYGNIEKQSESNETKAKIFLINKGYPIDANGIFPTYKEMYNIIRDGLEKQDEYKSADNVEPKFKVGDWCIDNEDDTIFQIVKVLDNTYTYRTNEGKVYSCTHYSLEEDARLWRITDAKDGDVLVDAYGNIGIFEKCYDFDWMSCCSLGNNGDFQYFTVEHENEKTYPATKEQIELFFQKMKEAGWEWDVERKEAKKK